MTTLPRDTDNNPIQALRLDPEGSHALNATSTSTRNSTAFADDTRVVSLYATGAVYVKFGLSDVIADANDHYFPSGLYYDFAIGGGKTLQYTHIAVIAADTACTVYLSEKQ